MNTIALRDKMRGGEWQPAKWLGGRIGTIALDWEVLVLEKVHSFLEGLSRRGVHGRNVPHRGRPVKWCEVACSRNLMQNMKENGGVECES